jgi:hypothetical protein
MPQSGGIVMTTIDVEQDEFCGIRVKHGSKAAGAVNSD